MKLLVDRGRPMGQAALAARLGVDLETFRDVHEPWLERSGLVERTELGRVATGKAIDLYGSALDRRSSRTALRLLDELIPGLWGSS